MLTQNQREKIVASLRDSHRTRVQGPRPSEMFPDVGIADSHAISSMLAQRRVADGATVVGHKIGLTSRAMQAASKFDEPDWAISSTIFVSRLLRRSFARDLSVDLSWA